MSAPHTTEDPVEGVGHERRDISVYAVAIFLVGLELCMLACCFLGYGFHRGYLYWMKISEEAISPMASYVTDPPKPHLQEDPTAELQGYREEQATLVSTYGWIDTQTGVVRLSLERAKQLVAERGLPSRPETKS